MEYAEGGVLNKKIIGQRKIGQQFEEIVIMKWFLELCEVIQFCHQNKIIHRDLKPLNIFLTKNNHVKLGDFGLSKILKSLEDKAKTMGGTLYYMSPEVIQGEKYTYSCDIWSLGIILNELCLLWNPLSNIKEIPLLCKTIIKGDVGIVNRECQENYSKNTCDLIKKILVKNPNERPTIDKITHVCKKILYELKNKQFNDYNPFFERINNNSPNPLDNIKLKLAKIRENKINRKKRLDKMREYNYNEIIQVQKKEKILHIHQNKRIKIGIVENNNNFEDEDELKKTMEKIRNEGFQLINKRKKNEEPYKIKPGALYN